MITLPTSAKNIAKALNDNLDVLASESVAKAAQRKEESKTEMKVWRHQRNKAMRKRVAEALNDTSLDLSDEDNALVDDFLAEEA